MKIWIDIEDNKKLFATFFKTYTGFEIRMKNVTKTVFSIDHEGKISKYR